MNKIRWNRIVFTILILGLLAGMAAYWSGYGDKEWIINYIFIFSGIIFAITPYLIDRPYSRVNEIVFTISFLGLIAGIVAYIGGYKSLAKISYFTIIIGNIIFFITNRQLLKYALNYPDVRWSISIILLISTWMGVAPAFYGRITNCAIAVWQERFYNLFNHNTLLNIPFGLCIVFFFYYWSKRIMQNNKSSYTTQYYGLFLIAFVYCLLYWKSPFRYASIVRFLDYRLLLSILLLSPTALYLWSLLFYSRYRINEQTDVRLINYRTTGFTRGYGGFSTEGVSDSDISDDLKRYARSIVNRLLGTDLMSDSFAVGITSEWGAGKTTFLGIIENEFRKTTNDNIDIVRFNPWMCRTPEQLTSDFFSSLRHQLSDKHRELSQPIKQYARYLKSASLRFPGLTLKFSDFLSEKSLFEKKKELSDKFSMLDNKVVVIIDDIDRLESSEVLEVLRLIRNTADLKNVIYIAAFDKEYVTTILEEKKIAAPKSYLEKIFQVEIQLPLVPKERIISTLINEITQYSHGLVIIQAIDFNEYYRELILKVITSYRKAKRFARLFSLNYTHLYHTSFDRLVWQDIFWLELLQVSDKSTYDHILCNDPKIILSETNNCYVYYNNDENRNRFKDKPITHEILLVLFGDLGSETPHEYSIRRTKYYGKYFTMEVQFSKEDLENLLNADNVDKLVKEWSEKRKPIDSFSQIINDYDKDQLIIKKRKLINGVFAILYYYQDKHGGFQDELDMSLTRFFNAINENGLEAIRTWFDEKLTIERELPRMLTVLLLFYGDYYLGNKKVTDAITKLLIKKIIDVFFQKHADSTVLELKRGNEELYDIAYRMYWGFQDFFVESLIDYCSKMDKKPTIKEFDAVEIENKSVLSYYDYKKREYYLQKIRETCCSDKPIKSAKKNRFAFPWKKP